MVQDLNESSSSSSSDEEKEDAAAAAPEAAQEPADQPWETQPAAEAEVDIEEIPAAAEVAVKEEEVEEEAAAVMQMVVKDEAGVSGEEATEAGTSGVKLWQAQGCVWHARLHLARLPHRRMPKPARRGQAEAQDAGSAGGGPDGI